jgi:hypothetical protein
MRSFANAVFAHCFIGPLHRLGGKGSRIEAVPPLSSGKYRRCIDFIPAAST